MDTNLTSTPLIHTILDWYYTPLGASLLKQEEAEINRIIAKFPGQYLVKLGGPRPSQDFFSNAHPNAQKIYLIDASINPEHLNLSTSSYNSEVTDIIQCHYHELPLACESVDIMVIHHALEFTTNPRGILEEVYHTLTHTGRLIIVGFNPHSLWGTNNWHNQENNRAFASSRFISFKHVRTWLKQLNFVISNYKTCYFRPPWQNEKKLKMFGFLDKTGRLLWPRCGACYFITAEREKTLITPNSIPEKTKALLHHLAVSPKPVS